MIHRPVFHLNSLGHERPQHVLTDPSGAQPRRDGGNAGLAARAPGPHVLPRRPAVCHNAAVGLVLDIQRLSDSSARGLVSQGQCGHVRSVERRHSSGALPQQQCAYRRACIILTGRSALALWMFLLPLTFLIVWRTESVTGYDAHHFRQLHSTGGVLTGGMPLLKSC
jgi:hypothetical protein